MLCRYFSYKVSRPLPAGDLLASCVGACICKPPPACSNSMMRGQFWRALALVLPLLWLGTPSQGQINGSTTLCQRTSEVRDAILYEIRIINNRYRKGNEFPEQCRYITNARLSSLRELSRLRVDDLRILDAGDFAGLPHLRELTLRSGERGLLLLDGAFSGLRLTKLDLGGVRLLPEAIFSGLSTLRELRLHGYGLPDLPPRIFAGLNALRELHIRGGLTSLPAAVFSGLPLYELYITHTKLTTLPASVFAGLTKLNHLSLGWNELTTLPASVFADLSGLGRQNVRQRRARGKLSLQSNKLTCLPDDLFANLHNFPRVVLDYNPLTCPPPPLPDPLQFAESISNQTLASGSSIRLNLPVAIGGSGSYGYRLSVDVVRTRHDGTKNTGASAHPNSLQKVGFRFDSTARPPVLVIDRAKVGTHGLNYWVDDTISGRRVGQEFTVRVVKIFDDDSTTVQDQVYTQNQAIDALTLPVGIDDSFTYSLAATTSDGLPAGLNFSPATRQLTGTPTEPGIYSLTYAVTTSGGFTVNLPFDIQVLAGASPSPSPSPPRVARSALASPSWNLVGDLADQYLPVGTAFELQLPAATGNEDPRAYTLTATTSDGTLEDGLPAGLSFSRITGQLTGTPTEPGIYNLTYRLSDTSTLAPLTFDIEVFEPLGFGLERIADLTYLTDTPITHLGLPEATGGSGTLQYSLTLAGSTDSNLPAGLAFSAASRQLAGAPSQSDTYSLTYRVADSIGNTASLTFNVRVVNAVNFAGAQVASQLYQQANSIEALTLPIAADGGGDITYSLRATTDDGTLHNDLPEGLSFSPESRQLSGTPTEPGIYSLTYRVSDSLGDQTAELTFDIEVFEPLGFGQERIADLTYLIDNPITYLGLPAAIGGGGTLQYSLTLAGSTDSALPAGLAFSAASRQLTGTPSQSDTYSLTYQVADSLGNTASLTFNVRVVDAVNFAGAQVASRLYQQDRSIEALTLPIATDGGGDITYSLRATTADGTLHNDLPDGLSFSPESRQLTGTPTEPGIYSLTYRVSDSLGDQTVELTFDIEVFEPLGFGQERIADLTYLIDNPITHLGLPAAIGGGGTLQYSLTVTGSTDSALPAGLAFSAASRQLTGTPSQSDTYSLTYQVADSLGNTANLTFNVRVVDAVNFAGAQVASRLYQQDRSIETLTLPRSADGGGDITYSLRATTGDGTLNNGLPVGLSFSPESRQLSGTPTEPGIYSLTYRVTDSLGNQTAELTFDLEVFAPLGFGQERIADRTYLIDNPITHLGLPTATGGGGTLQYSLTVTGSTDSDLPAGLAFSTASRQLTGTPFAGRCLFPDLSGRRLAWQHSQPDLQCPGRQRGQLRRCSSSQPALPTGQQY